MNRLGPFILMAFLLPGALSMAHPVTADDRIYRVGILDFPPYAVIEKSGACKGILVDVLERVLKQAGISYNLTGFPQKRLFDNLTTGATDIYIGIKGVPDYDGNGISDAECGREIVRYHQVRRG